MATSTAYASTATLAGVASAWTSKDNATGAPNGTFASVVVDNTEILDSGFIILSGFVLSTPIPPYATINGVTITATNKTTSVLETHTATLYSALTAIGSAKSYTPPVLIDSSDIGANNDIWSAPLTPSAVNGTFGVGFRVQTAVAGTTFDIDAALLAIDYTDANPATIGLRNRNNVDPQRMAFRSR